MMTPPEITAPETLANTPQSAEAVARMLDHAILHPTFTDAQMRDELLALRPYPIASICIKPYAVRLACEVLEGTPSPRITSSGSQA